MKNMIVDNAKDDVINQTDESLDGFAKWNPDFDSQK